MNSHLYFISTNKGKVTSKILWFMNFIYRSFSWFDQNRHLYIVLELLTFYCITTSHYYVLNAIIYGYYLIWCETEKLLKAWHLRNRHFIGMKDWLGRVNGPSAAPQIINSKWLFAPRHCPVPRVLLLWYVDEGEYILSALIWIQCYEGCQIESIGVWSHRVMHLAGSKFQRDTWPWMTTLQEGENIQFCWTSTDWQRSGTAAPQSWAFLSRRKMRLLTKLLLESI